MSGLYLGQGLTSLHTLEIEACADLARIDVSGAAATLSHLFIKGCTYLTVLDGIQGCAKLVFLSIHGRISALDVSAATQLQVLHCPAPCSLSSIKLPVRAPDLHHMCLYSLPGNIRAGCEWLFPSDDRC
jgi:hypothetical protein